LDVTCDLLRREVEEGECVTEMREECVIDQDTLLSCDKACDMIEATELYLSRVLSIGNKTGLWNVVEFDFEAFKCKGGSGEAVIEGDEEVIENVITFLKEEGGGVREPDEVEICVISEGGKGKIAGREYLHMKEGGKGVVYGVCCNER